MSKLSLKKALTAVLKANSKSADIAEDDGMVTDLVARLTDEPSSHLKAFVKYLEAECDLAPSVIGALAEALMLTPDASKVLGIKAVNLWLEFKIY
jgi:hypothetical protein